MRCSGAGGTGWNRTMLSRQEVRTTKPAAPPGSRPILPVSPGCRAAVSAFALRPWTHGCHAGVFPSVSAPSPELASVGPITGTGISARRWRVFRIYHFPACFDQRKNGSQTLPTPVRFVYIGSALTSRHACCSALGVAAGFRPPRPVFPGVRCLFHQPKRSQIGRDPDEAPGGA